MARIAISVRFKAKWCSMKDSNKYVQCCACGIDVCMPNYNKYYISPKNDTYCSLWCALVSNNFATKSVNVIKKQLKVVEL